MKNRILVGTTLAALMPAGQAFADGSSEAQKQATRLISQAVSQRIGATTDLASSAQDATHGFEGSSAWGLLSYTNLQVPAADDFEANFALFSAGFDKGHGNSITGISASINVGSADFSAPGVSSSTDDFGFSITPYGAWKINDGFFISGLFGYSYDYATVDTTITVPFTMTISDEVSSSVVYAEVAANFVQKMDNVILREKISYRPNYVAPDQGDSVFSSSAVLFGEAEFKTSDRTSIFINAETDYTMDDESEDRYPIYVGAGFQWQSGANSQWSIGYQTVFNDDTIDINTVMATGRFRF